MDFVPKDRSIKAETIKYEVILVELAENGVCTITFNRPSKRNAMNPRFHAEMTDILDRLQYDPRVRCLVLTGAGPAFCAGMDLKEFFAETYDKPGEFDRLYWECCDWRARTLKNYAKPTIAMVNGFCFGAALSTLEACDLAVAADTAQFGLSEINFGIFPGGPVSKTMADIMSPRHALYYALTGKPFDAKRAEEVGLINYSVAADKLKDDVMALAAELASKNPEAVRATKEAFRNSLMMNSDMANHYAFVRHQALTYNQKGAWLDTGVKDFVGGKFKSGLEAHPGLANR